MATLKQQLNKARTVTPQSQINILFNFIRSIEKQLADLNRDQIFQFSSDIFGNALGFYSQGTEKLTTQQALLGGSGRIKREGEPFDLKDTNVFLPSIFATVSRDFVTFGASDPKTDDILDNPSLLSKDIFGITDTNLNKVIKERILPFYQQSARKQLGL